MKKLTLLLAVVFAAFFILTTGAELVQADTLESTYFMIGYLDEFGDVVWWADGNPIGCLEYNPSAMTDLQAANYFLANTKVDGYLLSEFWKIRDPWFNHVFTDIYEELIMSESATPSFTETKYHKCVCMIVEPTHIPLSITHKIYDDKGEVASLKTEGLWKISNGIPKPDMMGAYKLNEELYQVTYDPDYTKVKELKEFSLVWGQDILKGYEVTMYYTRGVTLTKETEPNVTEKTQSVVAAPAPAPIRLPATGSADGAALIVSSLGLIALSILFRRR